MNRLSIRRLLLVTVVVAISISILLIKPAPPQVMNAGEFVDSSSSHVTSTRDVMRLWPVRFLAFVGSCTLVLHVVAIAIAIGFRRVARWAFVILAPTVAFLLLNWYLVTRPGYGGTSLGIGDLVAFGLTVNGAAYVILCTVLATPELFLEAARELRGEA